MHDRIIIINDISYSLVQMCHVGEDMGLRRCSHSSTALFASCTSSLWWNDLVILCSTHRFILICCMCVGVVHCRIY